MKKNYEKVIENIHNKIIICSFIRFTNFFYNYTILKKLETPILILL